MTLVSAGVLVSVAISQSPVSALSCARDWGADTFDGARGAVEGGYATWADALLVGTITAIEDTGAGERRILTVQPEIVFRGAVRDTVRVSAPNDFEGGFTTRGRYFLVLYHPNEPESDAWFVHPCGPTMQLTSADQLAQLRAVGDDELVLSEPAITATGGPPVSGGLATIAVIAGAAWVWTRRSQRSRDGSASHVGMGSSGGSPS